MSEQAIERVEPEVVGKELIGLDEHGLQLESLTDLWRFAQYVANSGLAPRSLNTAEKVLVAIQTGMEAGLKPMQALSAVVVINGTPSWKGDQALALVRNSGLLEDYSVRHEGQGDEYRCVVTVKRTDRPPVERDFSVAKAKKAGLWGKQGPWSQYSDRMLMYRALGFALRDEFSDVLCGLRIAEEQNDIPRRERPALKAPPPPDPLLEKVGVPVGAAPTTPKNTRQKLRGGDDAPPPAPEAAIAKEGAQTAPEALTGAEGRAALQAEIKRRVGCDAGACADLEKELGVDLEQAFAKLKAHPTFGDAAVGEQLSL